MKKTPCKPPPGMDNCPDRTPTCHDTCERYLEWKEYKRAERHALSQAEKMRRTVEALHAEGIKRTMRGRK